MVALGTVLAAASQLWYMAEVRVPLPFIPEASPNLGFCFNSKPHVLLVCCSCLLASLRPSHLPHSSVSHWPAQG